MTMPDDLKLRTIPQEPKKLLGFMKAMLFPPDAPSDLPARAVIYDRKSIIETEAVHHSNVTRVEAAEQFIKDRGWTRGKLYQDLDYSGANPERPAYQRMLQDAETGQFEVLVFSSFDRGSRSVGDFTDLIAHLDACGVRFCSVLEAFDTGSPSGRIIAYILVAIAELFLWITSHNIRLAKARRAASGLPNGRLPFGYCKGNCQTCGDPNGEGYCPHFGQTPDLGDGRIPIPHPLDRHAYVLMASLPAQGLSAPDMAHYFNTHTFRLPDGQTAAFRSKSTPQKEASRRFKKDSILDMLRNPFYAGFVAEYERPPYQVYSKTKAKHPPRGPLKNLHRGQHEALIPISVWMQNRDLLEKRRKGPRSRQGKAYTYVLSGNAYCWECHTWSEGPIKAKLRGVKGSKRGLRGHRCATVHDSYKKKPKPPVNDKLPAVPRPDGTALLQQHRKFLSEEPLLAELEALLSRLVLPPEWCDTLIALYLSDQYLSEYSRKARNLHRKLARLRQLYLRDMLSLAELEHEVTGIHQALATLRPSAQPEAQELQPYLTDFRSLWRQLTRLEQRRLQEKIFSALYFDADQRLRRALPHAPFARLLDLPEDGRRS